MNRKREKSDGCLPEGHAMSLVMRTALFNSMAVVTMDLKSHHPIPSQVTCAFIKTHLPLVTISFRNHPSNKFGRPCFRNSEKTSVLVNLEIFICTFVSYSQIVLSLEPFYINQSLFHYFQGNM